MGFFASGRGKAQPKSGALSVEFLHKFECSACPLNKADVRHGKMPPSGADNPDVYIIGEAPGDTEDRLDEQFVGKAGETLRARVPRKFQDRIRWNNTIRTRPPKNRDPEWIEIECCRPSIERDIAKSKPKAIFAMGSVPLKWVLGNAIIGNWRGRRLPVCIGGHACWLFPIHHPSYVNRVRSQKFGAEIERMFNFDLARAFAAIDSLPPPIVHTRELAEANIEIMAGGGLKEAKRVTTALRQARKDRVTGLDFETTRLRPYETGAQILTVGIATRTGAFSFVLDHPRAPWTPEAAEEVRRSFVEFLTDPDVIKAVHSLPFELEWIAFFFGRKLLRIGTYHDTMSQAAILDERVSERRGQGNGCLSLGFLTTQYFGLNVKDLSLVNRASLINEPIAEVLRYNAIDAKYHLALHLAQEERLKAEQLWEVYVSHLRRIAACVLTQFKGIYIDLKESARLAEKYAALIAEMEDGIADMKIVRQFESGEKTTFNPGSNQQLVVLLRDYLKTNIGYDGDTGKYSVDEAVLEQVDHPVGKAVVDYRHYTKLKSTYIDPLRTLKPAGSLYTDGLIHPILHTNFAETGRSSSADPNEQNFVKHDEGGVEVRGQIVAPDGYSLVAFDFGQIQARLIAMSSRDSRLIKSFFEDYDIHMDWARWFAHAYPSLIGGKKFMADKTVMDKLRQKAKNRFVFAAFFGAQEWTISQGMEAPENVCKRALKEFWDHYPGIREWHEELGMFYRKHGYVESLAKRRRRGPLSSNKIINSPIQADESEIVFHAMSTLSERENWHMQPIMEIHDDLTFMLPTAKIDAYSEIIISDMLDIPFDWINVPLVVEQSIGTNWLNMKPVGKFRSDVWFG